VRVVVTGAFEGAYVTGGSVGDAEGSVVTGAFEGAYVTGASVGAAEGSVVTGAFEGAYVTGMTVGTTEGVSATGFAEIAPGLSTGAKVGRAETEVGVALGHFFTGRTLVGLEVCGALVGFGHVGFLVLVGLSLGMFDAGMTTVTGAFVGEYERGVSVGAVVGAYETGAFVGASVGAVVGAYVGASVGAEEGS
jgi:hypothetical protein